MRKGSLNPDDNSYREVVSAEFFQPAKGSKNLRGLTLYTYRSMFLLKPGKETGINKQLWIDRNTNRPAELDDVGDVPPGFSMIKECSALLGIINVMDCQFLMTVDDVVQVCTLQGHKIYTISSVSFISMEVEEVANAEKKKIVHNYLMNIRKLLSFGYYFSPTYDLTLSKQKNFNKCPTDRQFQWNHSLYSELNKFNIDSIWQIQLIQGFVGHFTAAIDSKTLDYYLISRRSCMNSGTRYYSRGLDDSANVANFVETEQIVTYQNVCCSQLQVRGSVPVFWKQKGLQAIIKLERNYELTNHVFLNHMKTLTDNYGFIICLNLMTKTRKDEQMISDAFENHLKTNVLNDVGYEYFDFHAVVQGQRYDKTNVLLYKIQPALDTFGYHFESAEMTTVIQEQKGVIRTNCQDCLDRTNYIQSKIAMTALDNMLEKMGIKLRQLFGKEAFEELDNTETKNQYSLVIGFKNLWGDNGDALSIHYTGAGSAIAEVTRVGKGSLFGIFDRGVKGVSRFYNGSFEDKLKQECLDFLLGKNTVASGCNSINEAYELEIQSRQNEFATLTPLNVFVVTWNVAGSPPDTNLDLRNLFNYRGKATPDIVLVGFQEVVELNPTTVMSNNHQKPSIQLWKDCILNTLRKQDKYITVSEVDLVGLLLLVFAKEDCSKRIVKVQADKVKCGLKGTLGNKGGVVVKLSVDDTTFSFVNCHLVPSASGLEERLINLLDIHRKAFQQEEMGVRKADRIMHSDVKFLFGDTNFRLSTGHNARVLIGDYKFLKTKGEEKKALEVLQMLLKYDQLHQNRENDKILRHYQEGNINFLPTYKYDPFSEEYDTSKKQRVPAWTDRILWSSHTTAIEQHYYDRVEYLMSDHRPVISYFTVQVKRVDKAKKEEVTKNVYEVDYVMGAKRGSKELNVSEIIGAQAQFFDDPRPKSKSFVTGGINQK